MRNSSREGNLTPIGCPAWPVRSRVRVWHIELIVYNARVVAYWVTHSLPSANDTIQASLCKACLKTLNRTFHIGSGPFIIDQHRSNEPTHHAKRSDNVYSGMQIVISWRCDHVGLLSSQIRYQLKGCEHGLYTTAKAMILTQMPILTTAPRLLWENIPLLYGPTP
jgi:hypothetical protein